MQLDWFPGRSLLSDKLLRAHGNASDYDEEVKAELGEDALPAFNYALGCFEGLQRSSGEPAICHTADVAIRAADLGLPSRYVITALLHDSVEDTSSNPAAYVSGIREIERRFGKEIRDNVRLLTNRYSILVNHAIKSLGARSVPLKMNPESLTRVAAEVRVIRRGLEAQVQESLAEEYNRLAQTLTDMDLSTGQAICQVNRKYNITTEIALHVYGLFIDDMVDDFKKRDSGQGPGAYDVVLVVKFMDAIDNLRTSAATEKMKLEKILRKTQMVLDKSFHLHEYMYQNNLEDRIFSLAYEYLKYTMVEQMIERKRALQNLADTRFSPLSDFMVEQISGLETKYKIEHNPPERLRELRQELRDLNAAPAG
jgi:(p)ppGpp synthase/HD superfamily hydrolase